MATLPPKKSIFTLNVLTASIREILRNPEKYSKPFIEYDDE